MAMETALDMSHAMGRTLVLPPEQRFYLLNKDSVNNNNGDNATNEQQRRRRKTEFDFGDFFHLDRWGSILLLPKSFYIG